MSKKNESMNGLSSKELLSNLTSNISIAKGMLAILEIRHQSLWTKKLEKTPQEHLRILLEEVMDEIWNAENNLTTLSQRLETIYQGICLH